MIEEKMKGTSLAQRHKSLNEIVLATTPEQFTPELISQLSDNSQLDQIYIAEVANKLKNSAVIFELLKSEDGIILSKALKCKWFFNKKFNKDIDVDYFTENLFPFVSYSTKCKIITNLNLYINDQHIAELLYKSLLESHGRESAIKLLPACSENFIWDNIKIPDWNISELQFKYLYRKYPQLIIRYVKGCLEAKIFCDELLLLIINDHPEVFKELYEAHNTQINIKFSYRMSYYFLKNDPEFILKYFSNISDNIDVEALLKVLKGDKLDQFMIKLFPSDKKEYPHKLQRFLDQMKPEYASLYLIKLYEKVYEKSGLINTAIQSSMIEKLPVEMRRKWVEYMMTTDPEEAKYLKYLSTDEAIERYKILNRSASTTYERSYILEGMINCCEINKDTVALLDVMKYVAKRHRNDAEDLRYNFMMQLQNNFELHKLSSEHWDIIDEMLTIMYINKEIEKNYRYHFLSSILEEKIHYNLIHGIEIVSVVNKMLEYNINKFNILTGISDYEERILNTLFDKHKSLILDQEMDSKIEGRIILLLNTYNYWNINNPKNTKSVTDCEWLLNAIRNWFLHFDKQHKTNSLIVRLLWGDFKARNIFSNELFQAHCNERVVRNLLIHNVDIVSNNIDFLLTHSSNSYSIEKYRYFFYKIKAYIAKPLGESIKSKLLNEIENPGLRTPESIGGLISSLLLLLDSKEYKTILEKYTSSETKIEIDKANPNNQGEYQKSASILEKIKYTNPPVSFEMIQRYAKDDLLKFALPAILSMSFKKSPNLRNDFLMQISRKNCPVSIKKHSVRLFYFLYPTESLISIYKEMWNGEKNSSMRDVIFKRCFRILLTHNDNPKIITNMWQIMKQWLLSFTEEDKNLFCYFTNICKINESIFAEYSEVSWAMLQKLDAEKKINVNAFMSKFIDVISARIESLNEQFCELIVNEYLSSVDSKKSVTDLPNSLLHFCVSYLTKVKSVESQTKRTTELCAIFQKFILRYWDRVGDDYSSRKSVDTFVTQYCKQILIEKSTVCPLPALISISDMFNTVLPFEAVFDMQLYIKLTMLMIQSRTAINSDTAFTMMDVPGLQALLNQFSKFLVEYFDVLINKYGSQVRRLYLTVLNEFMTYIFSNCSFKNCTLNLYFLKELFHADSKSKHNLELIVDLLPNSPQSLVVSDLAIFGEIIELIVSCDDILIKMMLNCKIGVPSSVFKNADGK